MSELSFAEIDGQRVELLPARTVMSLFAAGCCGGGSQGGTATGGRGGNGRGGLGIILQVLNIPIGGDNVASAGNGTGGAGGAAS